MALAGINLKYPPSGGVPQWDMDAFEVVAVVVVLLMLLVVVLAIELGGVQPCVLVGLMVVCPSDAPAPDISDPEVGASNVTSLWSPYEARSA